MKPLDYMVLIGLLAAAGGGAYVFFKKERASPSNVLGLPPASTLASPSAAALPVATGYAAQPSARTSGGSTGINFQQITAGVGQVASQIPAIIQTGQQAFNTVTSIGNSLSSLFKL